MPIAGPGVISLTKFYRFPNILDELYLLQPGVSTAGDVLGRHALEPLWDDIVVYDPRPSTTSGVRTDRTALVVDDELLRVSPADEGERSAARAAL